MFHCIPKGVPLPARVSSRQPCPPPQYFVPIELADESRSPIYRRSGFLPDDTIELFHASPRRGDYLTLARKNYRWLLQKWIWQWIVSYRQYSQVWLSSMWKNIFTSDLFFFWMKIEHCSQVYIYIFVVCTFTNILTTRSQISLSMYLEANCYIRLFFHFQMNEWKYIYKYYCITTGKFTVNLACNRAIF